MKGRKDTFHPPSSSVRESWCCFNRRKDGYITNCRASQKWRERGIHQGRHDVTFTWLEMWGCRESCHSFLRSSLSFFRQERKRKAWCHGKVWESESSVRRERQERKSDLINGNQDLSLSFFLVEGKWTVGKEERSFKSTRSSRLDDVRSKEEDHLIFLSLSVTQQVTKDTQKQRMMSRHANLTKG